MNEEELKEIWKTDQTAPTIDFARFEEILSAWQDKLRRKIKIDIAVEFISVGVVLLIVLFYPKLFFIFWFALILAVWYIWEILKFYQLEKRYEDYNNVKQFLNERFLAMKSFIWRARIVLYFFPLPTIPAAFYAFGYFSDPSSIDRDLIISLISTLAIGEIVAIILTEIYFRIFYHSAISELKDLLRELDS